jgi:hypothetical protein
LKDEEEDAGIEEGDARTIVAGWWVGIRVGPYLSSRAIEPTLSRFVKGLRSKK